MGRTSLEGVGVSIAEDRSATLAAVMEAAAPLRSEAVAALGVVQASFRFTSDRRLAIARRYLDRVDGILSQVAELVSVSRALRFETAGDEQEALARSSTEASQLSARGYAADERSSTYVLRNLGTVRVANQARHTFDQLADLQRHLRGIRDSINGHRLEALTLLRMGSQIAAEEYDV